ncbi:MAG: polymorphic toxin-type HINT domain-containing protein, partial [Myxococcota bacterium]
IPCRLCFVEDTPVRTPSGTTDIDELRAGDVVISEAVDDPDIDRAQPPTGWHPIASEPAASTCHTAASPWTWLFTALAALAVAARRRRAPAFTLLLTALLAATLPLSCADPGETMGPANPATTSHLVQAADLVRPDGASRRVSVDTFDPRTLSWDAQWLEQVGDGETFRLDAALYRRAPDGFVSLGPVDDADLDHATATLTDVDDPRPPTASDWVLVLDDSDLRPARLQTVSPGTRVAFQGWLYDTRGDGHIEAVHPTGQALTRVRQPHRRVAPATHVLTIRGEDGTQHTLEATPEHPFWSPDAQRWVDLEDLEPGDALWADGVRSEVVERRVVHGDVEVFNVEVDGLHIILKRRGLGHGGLPPLGRLRDRDFAKHGPAAVKAAVGTPLAVDDGEVIGELDVRIAGVQGPDLASGFVCLGLNHRQCPVHVEAYHPVVAREQAELTVPVGVHGRDADIAAVDLDGNGVGGRDPFGELSQVNLAGPL